MNELDTKALCAIHDLNLKITQVHLCYTLGVANVGNVNSNIRRALNEILREARDSFRVSTVAVSIAT